MAFFNQLLNYLWQILTFVGGITAAVGVFRWVSGGKAHDAQAQEGAVWVIQPPTLECGNAAFGALR